MDVSFKQLEVFNAVVVAGSISKATRLTGLSQPTISQQLAKFEEDLGSQLIYRRRSARVELTPAGEFWFRTSTELLKRRHEAADQHREQFQTDQMVLRFGTTPSLRGSFCEAAGKIAVRQGRFSRFEFVWALNSDEIVDMLDTHQLNCAVVSASSVEAHRSMLHVVPLFRDRIVWVVPRGVPTEVIIAALSGRLIDADRHEALTRRAEVTGGVGWHLRSRDWFRTYLPHSQPFFGCMTHQAAVDFVAAGLATCHAPLSLIPNLPEQVRSRLQRFDLQEFARDAVYAMPRHLLSLRPFMDFQTALTDYVRAHYDDSHTLSMLRPLPVEAPILALPPVAAAI